MAVRLQMKLGVVAEQDRLPDSPDTVVVVEPSVGSVARSKGHLYLLVTSRNPGNKAHEATRLAAETIRNEYYYDESGGIRVCIEKAIRLANKRLAHQRDRLSLGESEDGNGPIGIGVAVVRGNELYVATVGPAEAYLIRQARLSTLPDPHRERGLPAGELEPDVWRGEISVGDSLVLVSANVMSRLGADELKDAMVTLHPQSAMEHLHHRYVAADGTGSDGAIAFEATEVAATQKQRTLVPVKAAEPLAGAPERSPIPLAEPVAGSVAAVQSGARIARDAAGNAVQRTVTRLTDLLPQRGPGHRRVTPLSARRETQRRAAVAVLAFIVVASGLGLAIFLFGGGGRGPGTVISSFAAGQKAVDDARADLGKVFGPGVDLVEDDSRQALQLLNDALAKLESAEKAGIPASTVDPLRAQVIGGLDRIYRVRPVADRLVFAFAATKPPANLVAMVHGPGGLPYVLDRATKAVYRVDARTKKSTLVMKAGSRGVNGGTAAEPKFITVGGPPDLLIVDVKNALWRWRPSDNAGHGTLVRISVKGSASWGSDIVAVGTFVRNASADLYNFYVIDPSREQILSYAQQLDGGGFPVEANPWLDTARPLSAVSCLFIDGDLYLADAGKIARYTSGTGGTWQAKDPGDVPLRSAPRYTILTGGPDPKTGTLYAYDVANARVIAFDKKSGDFVEQYRIANGGVGLADARGMYVVPGQNGAPATLLWATANAVHSAVLEAVAETPSSASPSAGASGGPASSAKASPKASAKASPRPTAR